MLILSCEGEVDPEPTGVYTLDAPSYFGPFEVPEENITTHEGVRLGRALFYDTRLSGDNSMSCGSCHQQQFAFTDGKQFSTGITGTPGTFNAMSLQNLLWDSRFFWDGRSTSLEDQALQPIEDSIELHQSLEATVEKLSADPDYPCLFEDAFGDEEITAERIAKAIGQFERTLISKDSRFDKYLRNEGTLTTLELEGYQLFSTHPNPRNGIRGANCADCHLGPRTSGSNVNFQGFHNNGLDGVGELRSGLEQVTGDDQDYGKFKAPTLRNIALTAPYMHDGRFQTLEEVLDHYNEHIQYSETLDILITEASNNTERNPGEVNLGLTEEEKTALLAFLETLTDESFLTNPEFSDPNP